MFVAPMQGSLFGSGEPALDVLRPDRVDLDQRSWIDHQPAWLAGADTLFSALLDRCEWRQRTHIPMYERLVDEPRLVASAPIDGPLAEKCQAEAEEPWEIVQKLRMTMCCNDKSSKKI